MEKGIRLTMVANFIVKTRKGKSYALSYHQREKQLDEHIVTDSNNLHKKV